MDNDDEAGYQHVVRASVWALVFARHLGLSKSLMKSLAMGVLLSHIGKTKLDPSLRDPSVLSGDQLAQYQQYVELGLAELRKSKTIGDGVLSVVEFHAERNNGSGFPKGVTGERIPLLAKIAGLVDCYQDMITPRGDQLGMSPKDAVSSLYEQRNVLFQKDLVERFIEAIGVFPTGTLVELNSREVGIVSGHNSDRRLLPKIIVVTDSDKKKLKSGRRVDLLEWNASRKGQQGLFIKNSLPKGAFEIDENSYLLSGATSKWSLKHMVSSLSS
jgi:HD-GYP domain-containing protein (c-di-GMP phosphodiesterase class II)